MESSFVRLRGTSSTCWAEARNQAVQPHDRVDAIWRRAEALLATGQRTSARETSRWPGRRQKASVPSILLERVAELRHNVSSTYDAVHVALAEVLECELVTADGRLATATGPRCRFRLVASTG